MAAIETLLIANPLHILKGIAPDVPGVLKGPKLIETVCMDTRKMMYELFTRAQWYTW